MLCVGAGRTSRSVLSLSSSPPTTFPHPIPQELAQGEKKASALEV